MQSNSEPNGVPVKSLNDIQVDTEGYFYIQSCYFYDRDRIVPPSIPLKDPKNESYVFLLSTGPHAITYYHQPVEDERSGTKIGWYKLDSFFSPYVSQPMTWEQCRGQLLNSEHMAYYIATAHGMTTQFDRFKRPLPEAPSPMPYDFFVDLELMGYSRIYEPVVNNRVGSIIV